MRNVTTAGAILIEFSHFTYNNALFCFVLHRDENFFKDLRSVPFSDNSLWFLHLVQLKKLFLKLSSYVELFLHQDWSLLPVPDFKAVAQEASKESAHLNFIVAAVLLTSTHSGRSSRLLTVFNSFTGSQRRVLDKISEGVRQGNVTSAHVFNNHFHFSRKFRLVYECVARQKDSQFAQEIAG